MRKAARIDENQTEIVKCFRRMGYSVVILSAVGYGMTDIMVSRKGINCLVEIKDGNKYPSQQKLTDDQEIFHSDWQGLRAIVNSINTALQLANRLESIKLVTDKCGLDDFISGKKTLDFRE